MEDTGGTLLDALRDQLRLTSVKDGCSPQGQCGCCTVLIEGKPRVACVTPLRRVAGRAVTTVDGLEPSVRDALVASFLDHGASQCGFCTPGILCRLAALDPGTEPAAIEPAAIETALLAHLCRCTGWRSIVDAAVSGLSGEPPPLSSEGRSFAAAERRAALEGGVSQHVGPDVVLGRGGFAVDTAPPGALVAVPDGAGDWSVGATLQAARASVGKIQGRRSGKQVEPPIGLPEGDWAVTLRTTWVEPGYLEPDASWCAPGDEPVSAVANGGAFGAKLDSPAPVAARMLAAQLDAPVLVVLSREDAVRLGAKRPPLAAGVRLDGTGLVRVARTSGIAAAITAAAPGLAVEEVDLIGPRTTSLVRAAGWAEAAVLLAALRSLAAPAGPPGAGFAETTTPGGGWASAAVKVDPEGRPMGVSVTVAAGEVLDEVVLRSYVQGAAHMALGWVTSEGIAVGDDGVPEDLTIRSWGVLRARDTPPIEITITEGTGPAIGASDAAFAAVAAAVWIAQGLPPVWPTRRGRETR